MKLPEGWGTLAHIYLPAWFLAGIIVAWIASAALGVVASIFLFLSRRPK